MSVLNVKCYSGYKADEKPLSFILDGKKLLIAKIFNQWRSPGLNYFKVLADDGKTYLLKNYYQEGEWALEKIFE